MKFTLLAIAAFFVVSCQTVESISVSQIPTKSQRTNEVRSEASAPIILGIPFGTGFIEDAKNELSEKCAAPSRIDGVISKHTSTNYFIGLIVSQKVALSGYCVNPSKIKS